MTGPKTGASTIGTPIDAEDAAHPLRAGGAREDDHPGRHQHPAAEALEDAEDDQRVGRPGEAAEQRAEREEDERDQVEAPACRAGAPPSR